MFLKRPIPGKSPWYGGFSYVDLLYKGVTEKFLEVTMTDGYEKNSGGFWENLARYFYRRAQPGGCHGQEER